MQVVVGLLCLPAILAVFTLTRPAARRRPWWALTLATALVWAALVTVNAGQQAPQVASARASATTTTERPTSTTRERQSATTAPSEAEAPEGGRRSGSGVDVAAADRDAVDRAPASNELLEVLRSLTVEPERPRSGYERSLFPHWDDHDGDGCDTRCEVLSAQRRADGLWLSEWDGYSTDDPSELHVDHVVALAEAWDSGADRWSSAQRDDFADHLPNLLAVTASSNLRKSDKDAAEWFPSRAEANCLWASTVVRVKQHWRLAVDQAEADALGNLLRACGDYVAPTTTTTRAATTTTTAAPLPPPPPPPSSGCTPGYSPCIPPGDDVDCAGGGGNGPRYIDGPVSVDHAHGDPYELDRDGNGVGCEG